MRTDFDACAARPLTAEEISLYGYTGPLINIPRNHSSQITLEGCQVLCGNGTDWYPWSKQASTLTTWIFPVIGIILQAPFMSNAFWATVFALARWIGNPMVSLSYVLWNVKVAGKCALLVDMSVPYDTKPSVLTDRDSDYSSIRDSLYLLNVMNQYTMRPHIRQKKEAEGLLRIVLFSKDLRLLKEGRDLAASEPIDQGPVDGEGRRAAQAYGLQAVNAYLTQTSTPESDLESADYLNELRQKLAEDIRAARKRGAVPVYLSLLWFLFSLAISLQAAFGLLGLNSEAHDLALGCLLSWLPVLILCSVVDRNPVNPEKIQKKLNRLVDRVRTSLMDDHVRELYLHTIQDPTSQDDMRRRVGAIKRECNAFGDFFVKFGGQGRTRWHYGCAHPILKDIERAYIAGKGRDWLRHEREARTLLVLGDISGGLDWLDYRELWQVAAAVVIVGGTIFGAFCLSFFTPTVGLGCRSGGYLIFAILSFALLLAEMIIWWITDARKDRFERWLERRKHDRRNAGNTQQDTAAMLRARKRQARWKRVSRILWFLPGAISTATEVLLPRLVTDRLHRVHESWRDCTTPEKLQNGILRPIEAVNTIWLIYIVVAQTFGAYNTCVCHTSHWGNQDYIDFTQYSTTNNAYVRVYWIGGTVISVSTMGIALAYVVLQWCLQSHLSTLNRRKAARGLRAVRRFRVMTMPILWAYRLLPRSGEWIMGRLIILLRPRRVRTDPGTSKTTLRWTKENGPQHQQQPHRARSSSRGRQSAAPQRFTDPIVTGPEHSPSGSEHIRLIRPDFVHLQTPASGAHSPRSSDDRSVSPTTRGYEMRTPAYLTPEEGSRQGSL